jgi:hypothetical protein
VYCGQPAGFLRKRHPECHNRHQIAISVIPRFFSQVIESPISIERFTELLRAAADTAYIRPSELRSLCVSGLEGVIDTILQQRPLSSAEVDRVTDLADALGGIFPDGLGLDEKLAKVRIISELNDGKIADNVSIAGPVPVEFGRGESILWVFNHVRAFRMAKNDKGGSLKVNPTGSLDGSYVSPQMLEKFHVALENLDEEATGDVVLTNRNIFFLQNESTVTRIPIARILLLRVYAEGFHVACRPAADRSRMFLLDDTWFGANAVTLLVQLAHRQSVEPDTNPSM